MIKIKINWTNKFRKWNKKKLPATLTNWIGCINPEFDFENNNSVPKSCWILLSYLEDLFYYILNILLKER